MEKRDLRRARINAIVIGSLLCLTFISFIYAFVQHGIAEENERMAIEAFTLAKKNEQSFSEELERCKQQTQIEADRANAILARMHEELQSTKK